MVEPGKMVTIFVYGKLKPQYNPPTSMKNPRQDLVQGHLYNLGRDAALILGGDKWIEGWVMDVSAKEFKELCGYEAPEYKPMIVRTQSGESAYAFVYQLELPPNAVTVEDWEEKTFLRNKLKVTTADIDYAIEALAEHGYEEDIWS